LVVANVWRYASLKFRSTPAKQASSVCVMFPHETCWFRIKLPQYMPSPELLLFNPGLIACMASNIHRLSRLDKTHNLWLVSERQGCFHAFPLTGYRSVQHADLAKGLVLNTTTKRLFTQRKQHSINTNIRKFLRRRRSCAVSDSSGTGAAENCI
jgi:hypothetical protein